MMCPMKFGVKFTQAEIMLTDVDTLKHYIRCSKDECLWWIKEKENCAILVLIESISKLTDIYKEEKPSISQITEKNLQL